MAVTLRVAVVVLLSWVFLEARCGPLAGEETEDSLMKVLGLPMRGGAGEGEERAPVPQYMLELYGDATAGSSNMGTNVPYDATTITAVTVSEVNRDMLLFRPPTSSSSEQLVAVELHIHHGPLRGPHRGRRKGDLYKVEATVGGDSFTQLVAGERGGWLRFRISPTSAMADVESNCDRQTHRRHHSHTHSSTRTHTDRLHHTYHNSTTDNGESENGCNDAFITVSVKASTKAGRPVRMNLHHGDHVAARKSILVFFTKSLAKPNHLPMQSEPASSHGRVKRSILAASAPTNSTSGPLQNSTQTARETNNCVRQPLLVDFTVIGWDTWVVAPPSYNAYYCAGSCGFPIGQNQNPTNHATVMTLVRFFADDNTASEPHCVPSSYSDMRILYVDVNNNIVIKQFDNMVVESCGCR